MANHPNRSRIWQTKSGTVMLRIPGHDGQPDWVREFWVPIDGGYVREVDEHRWGLAGRQVCRGLRGEGATISATRDTLLDVIRREHAHARRKADY